MTAVRLKIDDIWYEGEGKAVLKGVNLEVPYAKGICLLDPTGMSSPGLLQICATLLEPTRGKIYLDGMSIPFDREIDLFPLRRKIAYVAWGMPLISNLTLLQNVSLGWAYHENKSLHDAWEDGIELLTYFRISDCKDMRPTEVNPEISKRAACARELAKKPSLILVDRIVESLSPEGQTLFASCVEKYSQELGSSLLVTSTSTATFAPLASLITRTYTLKDGRIVEENPGPGRDSI